eukprot:CAMPEP_0176351716 /NCGR_PEP_ID=MMETSP0126-20121128/10447_1 /TAXON_ID=141414 ORGANISM="Strombidinopsis acuminatum, Strain SPMC142" /NCGR_SAMPLE_ID=MMETSP0126 /ASSEMBLY_ACC=CAM_ASM_000229 /LENGTH=114 /DNA_ID=CAMNT_0017702393 /DNA_START=68 /DNA_END=412 /DNA_ORIENTATION=+
MSLIDTSKRVFYCPEYVIQEEEGDKKAAFEQGDVLYWCLKCKKSSKHEHKLKQLKGTVGDPFKGMLKKSDAAEDMTDEQKKEYLDSLFEEYYNLDCEDVIGGGEVTTRFKYTKV